MEMGILNAVDVVAVTGCLGRNCRKATIALALCVGAMGSALAAPPVVLTDASFLEIDSMVVPAKGRPNEELRLRGLKSYQTGNYRDAVEAFEGAAYHADKYSQHYLSLIHWHGVGVPVDRVQAYIWADLAAERGNSRPLLAIREKMWAQMDQQQQAGMEVRGAAYYARYGDAVAKPRTEGKMRAFARDMTGSRIGYRNQRLEVSGPPVNGTFITDVGSNVAAYFISQAASPDELYGKEGGLARLDGYWREQDRMLDGKVDVGPLETVRKPRSNSRGNGMGG